MLSFKQFILEKNPCWKGYKQLGMKNKKGKEVPNCIPESVDQEIHSTEMFHPESIESKRHVGYKSKNKLVKMKIDDFLTLAKKLNPKEEAGSAHKQENIKKSLDSGERIKEIPYLYIDSENFGNSDEHYVTGHEGRNRAKELKRRGYTHMPVELRHGDVRWDQQNDPSRWDYRETWPTKLRSEDKDKVLPYPVTRDDSGKSYE